MSTAPLTSRDSVIETARDLAPRLAQAGNDWDRAKMSTLLQVIEDEDHFDDKDAMLCLREMWQLVGTREERGSEATEHQVVVVFDVRACSRTEAAALVSTTLAMFPGSGFRDLIQSSIQEGAAGEVEAWWFPEADVKHIDGNDRDAFHLVPVTALDCQACDAAPGEACRPDCTGHPLT